MLNRIFDMAAHGYVVTHAYADGMVRMAKPVPNTQSEAVCWLAPDGSYCPPFFARKSAEPWMPDGNYMRTA